MLAVAVLVTGLAGCRVRVDKDKNGDEKRVQVDTPFGGVHVNTDQTTAADLGLPAYPGAELIRDDDKHESADVHLGFGQWELRVRAVSYASADPQDKVVAFYKQALGRYGEVLTCRNHQPVGSPKITSEGLTCEEDQKGAKVEINGHKNGFGHDTELELKAGSKRHQHGVGFEEPKDGKTRFAMVEVDLPADSGGGKSD
jgi:hypothetical protein